jgi:uncharacterized BrkB/YihY/UPF0761 family membrane protein
MSEAPAKSGARAKARAASARAEALSKRPSGWAKRQDPGSAAGVAVDAWRRYQAVDGPLQSALLSLYILVAVLPALLVMEEYLDPHPDSLAHSIIRHYNLNAPTASLLQGVLGEGRSHELGSALFAIAGALFFGLGFGRVLQLVHTRAWQLPFQKRQSDQALYAIILLGIYGVILLLLVQLNELSGEPSWVGRLLSLGWIALLVVFFVWGPWLLTHKQVTRRALLPAAALTGFGLVVVMLISGFVMQFWVNLYAEDYGGFGVVLAMYFWIAFSSAVIVWAASLSPALAQRRELRRRS